MDKYTSKLRMPSIGGGTGELNLKPTTFDQLPGWNLDEHGQVLEAMTQSCHRILKQDPMKKFGPNNVGGIYGDWQPACSALQTLYASGDTTNPVVARAFFEQWFTPYTVKDGMNPTGLFTGYYEVDLKGSLKPNPPFTTPLYRRPDDLVMVDLGAFRPELAGQRVAGRVDGNKRLTPYESRAQIENGALANKGLEIVYVNDPVDAFFLHIQGSGRIELSDGSFVRVGYDGQNGHPYYAIGRELIARGELTKDNVSMQTIRDWMKSNPQKAAELRNMNASYIFFRVLESDEPLGAEGVPLTPRRSMAVDRTLVPFGMPLWIDVDHPTVTGQNIQRLMVSQDTGGAINGPVRGDFFWGRGDEAEMMAGQMKSKGRYWFLMPKNMTFLSTTK